MMTERLLSDIEGMEHFMDDAPARGWTRCRGCVRMRSTLDENGVCDQCRSGVADGSIILAARDVDTPTPARLALVEPGFIAHGQPIGPAANTPMIAEQKQRPVKRRWYRRISRR